MRTWLENMVRRGALRALAFVVGVLCVVAVLLYSNRRPLLNAVSGPFPFTAADLKAVGRPETAPRYFVTVTGAEAAETGLNLQTVRTSDWVKFDRTVIADYYALNVGNKILIVETPKRSSPRDLTVTGILEPFPRSLQAEFEKGIGRENVHMNFYPFFLRVGSIKDLVTSTAFGLVIVVLILAVVAGPRLLVLVFPKSSAVLKRAARWGDLHLVSGEMEREYRSRKTSWGPWSITDHFLFRTKLFSFDAFRIENALWVYTETVSHVHVVCSDGTAVIRWPGELVDELAALISQRAPWAVTDDSEATRTRYKKDPRGFAEEIEKAKREQLRR